MSRHPHNEQSRPEAACSGVEPDTMSVEGRAQHSTSALQLPELPKVTKLFENEDHIVMGFTADQLRTYGQACASAALASAAEDTARLDAETEFEVHLTPHGTDEVMPVAWSNSLAEAMNYARQYVEEGSVEVFEVVRRTIASMRTTSTGGKE